MPYRRPSNPVQLSTDQKRDLLSYYFGYYLELAQQDPRQLNIKVPRDAFGNLLGKIGETLLAFSVEAVQAPGPLREFLDANSPPEYLKDLLPDSFRAFCLALNALKQWVSAEQAATDRYLLGGTVRQQCRQAARRCILTGEPLDRQDVELHHPVRDGRPPIPLSKPGHARIEGHATNHSADPHGKVLRALKHEGNRSWVQLRNGCLALSGQPVDVASSGVLASAKTFARKAASRTGMNYEQLIDWLDANGS